MFETTLIAAAWGVYCLSLLLIIAGPWAWLLSLRRATAVNFDHEESGVFSDHPESDGRFAAESQVALAAKRADLDGPPTTTAISGTGED